MKGENGESSIEKFLRAFDKAVKPPIPSQAKINENSPELSEPLEDIDISPELQNIAHEERKIIGQYLHKWEQADSEKKFINEVLLTESFGFKVVGNNFNSELKNSYHSFISALVEKGRKEPFIKDAIISYTSDLRLEFQRSLYDSFVVKLGEAKALVNNKQSEVSKEIDSLIKRYENPGNVGAFRQLEVSDMTSKVNEIKTTLNKAEAYSIGNNPPTQSITSPSYGNSFPLQGRSDLHR